MHSLAVAQRGRAREITCWALFFLNLISLAREYKTMIRTRERGTNILLCVCVCGLKKKKKRVGWNWIILLLSLSLSLWACV